MILLSFLGDVFSQTLIEIGQLYLFSSLQSKIVTHDDIIQVFVLT